MVYERPWNNEEELWEVAWQSFPPGTFKEPAIRMKPIEGIQPTAPPGRSERSRAALVVGPGAGGLSNRNVVKIENRKKRRQ